MRVISARLLGFRRFESAKIDLDASVLAIVGPNEAGKTSLLDALYMVDLDDPFDKTDLTRGSGQRKKSDPVIEARFLLEDEDRRLLASFGGVGEPRWFVLTKQVDGTRHFRLEPDLTRDKTQRDNAKEILQRSLRNPRLTKILSMEAEELDVETMRDGVLQAVSVLATEVESITKEQLDVLISVLEELQDCENIDGLRNSSLRDLRRATDALQAAIDADEREHPRSQAERRLEDERPIFLMFDDDSRNLKSEYAISELEDKPAALVNILSITSISVARVFEAMQSEDHAERAGLQRRINEELYKSFTAKWNQSNVYPQMQLEPDRIRIHVPSRDTLASIAERSDGLRTFIALAAFVERHGRAGGAVLMVDEAERHLHYDAQADLVRVFENQEVVEQIIYTTHSAGALPSDLGVGVRAILPTVAKDMEDSARSTITSSFWAEGAGFSPLLFAMGANVLAFAPARRAVLTEGRADAVLLPSLFRDAVHANLGFQMAPGLANISQTDAGELDLEAPRVAYLLDGDKGGRAHAKKLRAAGVSRDFIVHLPGQHCIEDYIHPDTYLAAVNEELRRSHGEEFRIEGHLPAKNRPRFIEDACSMLGVNPPDKVRVACRIVEVRRERPVLDPRRGDELTAVYTRLRDVLGLS